MARLAWAGAHPHLAALTLGPALPFQQIHSTRAARGVEAHVDRHDLAGCIIGWVTVTDGQVEAAERGASALAQEARRKARQQQGEGQVHTAATAAAAVVATLPKAKRRQQQKGQQQQQQREEELGVVGEQPSCGASGVEHQAEGSVVEQEPGTGA